MVTDKTSDQDTFYYPFDGLEDEKHRYQIKSTSKIFVREICEVQACRPALNDQARAQYAAQAGMKKAGWETAPAPADKKSKTRPKKYPVYDLPDIYDEFYYHAALAQKLFYGFPKLIEVNHNADQDLYEIEVVVQDLFDILNEGVVNKAFFDFQAARTGTQRVPGKF